MPKYYFSIDDGEPPGDPIEIELTGLTEAKCEAVRTAGATICDQAGSFWDRSEWTMTVTDEARLTLFTLQVIGMESAATRKLD